MNPQPQSSLRYIFLNDPRCYELIRSSPTQVLLSSDEPIGCEMKLLEKALFLELLRSRQIVERYKPAVLEAAPKAYQTKLIHKYENFMVVMKELVEQGQPFSTDKAYQQICAIVSERFPNQHKPYPSISSLAEEFKQYKASNFHSGSLMGKKRRPRGLNDTAADDYLRSFLLKNWSNAYKATQSKVYSFYVEEAQKLGLKALSRSTYRRRVIEITEEEIKYLNSNIEQQTKMLSTNLSKIRLSAPFERVEADRIHVHLQLLDKDGALIKGTVALYFLIDCYTRCILAWTYEIGTPETAEGVINLLTIGHKTSELNPYAGKIQQLVVDNGPGFKAVELTTICNSLGTSVTRVAAYSPFKKPFVEAFNKYFRDNFLRGHIIKIETTGEIHFGIPGYAGRNQSGQPDEGSKSTSELATLTHEQFHQALCDFMTAYHHQNRQILGGKTPHQMMTEPTNMFPGLPVDYAQIRHCFHYKVRETTLYERGFVILNNQQFSSTELNLLYKNHKKRGEKNLKVIVSYNPADATCVTVSLAKNGTEVYSFVVPNRDVDLFNDTFPSFAELNELRTPKQGSHHSATTFTKFVKRAKATPTEDKDDDEKTSKPEHTEPPSSLSDSIDASNNAELNKLARKQTKSLKRQPQGKMPASEDTSGMYSKEDFIR